MVTQASGERLRPPGAPLAAPSVDAVLDRRDVGVRFQPLVHLHTGEVLGYEALARGPAGTGLESPAALFRAAHQAGRAGELDWICRAAAFRAAIAARLHPSLTIFLNTEPGSFRVACPDDLRDLIAQGETRLRVVLEVNERDAAEDPAAVLATTVRARSTAWGVALANVGSAPASLALMPFIHPDVIKLDLRWLRDRGPVEVARVVNAVFAQVERTGAVILAEGIETFRDLDAARAMGAQVGQGHLLGRPAPPPSETRAPRSVVRLVQAPPPPASDATPFDTVTAARPSHPVTKELLVELCRHVQYGALLSEGSEVVAASLDRIGDVTASTVRLFEAIADRAAFTVLLGPDMPPAPGSGLRGVRLAATDRLAREVDVVVVGAHFSAALVARACGDVGAEAKRAYDMALTYDRDLVIRAATALVQRVTAGDVRAATDGDLMAMTSGDVTDGDVSAGT